jgi:hypothetical protein
MQNSLLYVRDTGQISQTLSFWKPHRKKLLPKYKVSRETSSRLSSEE